MNLDDKLIRECVRFKINILLKVVAVAKRLYFKKFKEAHRHKEKI